MGQDQLQQRATAGVADYDSLYQGNSGLEQVDLSFDTVPWDIGGPQPAVVELERAGAFRGRVLDVGCGPGDNAIFLARCGYEVTGVDYSPTAVDAARQRAAQQDSAARFVVDDATSLGKFEARFDTVLDSALYHCLEPQQRREYSAALHRMTLPGATMHLFCFADEGPGCFPEPLQVSADDLRSNLAIEWNISKIELAWYISRLTRGDLEVLMSQETGFPKIDTNGVTVDDQGRVRTPVWRLQARRR